MPAWSKPKIARVVVLASGVTVTAMAPESLEAMHLGSPARSELPNAIIYIRLFEVDSIPLSSLSRTRVSILFRIRNRNSNVSYLDFAGSAADARKDFRSRESRIGRTLHSHAIISSFHNWSER